jgi:hypothetical protein
MSKKDYIALAEILKKREPFISDYQFSHLLNDLMAYMIKDNPNFDKDKFMDAIYNLPV